VILGFLRLSTSARLFPRPLGVDEALQFIEALLAHPQARTVLPGEGHWPLLRHLLALCGSGGNLVNDAHLAAFALEHDDPYRHARHRLRALSGHQDPETVLILQGALPRPWRARCGTR